MNCMVALEQYEDDIFPLKAIINSLAPFDEHFSPKNVNISKILKESSDLIVKKLNSKFL